MTGETTLVDAALFPRLIVKVGGQVVREIELRGDLGIGRAEDNELQLPDPKASRHHARLHREGAVFVLNDLGSANGTRVNGILVTDPHPLEHGDRITVGDTELTYQEPGRAVQDTIVEGVPAGVKVAATGEVVRRVPPPPVMPAEPEKGTSRGLVIGLSLAAFVVFVAIVAISVYLLAPGVYQQLGLISPASPTAQVAAASPTPAAPAETPVATAAPTVITATPTATGVDPQEVNDLLTQAEALNRRSKFEDAIAIYENLAERVTDDARPEIGWAWALVLDDKATEALPHAQKAVELDPTSSEAAAVLGRAYAALGDVAQALTWAQKAVELDSGSAQAHAVLAEAYMLDGQTQQAVDEADLALVQDINNADAHRIRGWLYYVVDNDMGRAASELQIAAGLQPELWLRRHELGALLLEAEDFVTAIMAFQDALGIRPNAVTYSAIGEVYYQLGQYDQARASLQQALSAGAEDANTYALMAATYAQLDRCDDAETYYEQALELEPTNPLAVEAEELCQGDRPSPTPSPTTVSASQPTPVATTATTLAATKPPSQPAALSGRFAFPVWNEQTSKYDTYIANVDGSGRSLVAEAMHQPALRPDGSWIVLNGERTSFEHLSLAKPDGTELREITDFLEDGQPDWAPDGQRLVFASYRHGDKQYRIYVMDEVPFEGGTVEGRSLNYGPDDIRGQMPAWTSDGRIVYRGCNLESPRKECDGTGLYIISAAPGPQTPKQLTEYPEDMAPDVSGNQIAFMSNREGSWEIYIMNLDGSGLKRLTNNAANDGLPAWSPDGRAIAFVSNQGGPWAVWAMNPDGSNPRRLFNIGGGGLSFGWQNQQISWGR
jgi:tetratricopeptide (TPR) repeat protein